MSNLANHGDAESPGIPAAEPELYRYMFEESPCAMFLADLDGRVTATNPRMAQLSGLSSAKLAGVSVQDMLRLAGGTLQWPAPAADETTIAEARLVQPGGATVPVFVHLRRVAGSKLLGVVMDAAAPRSADAASNQHARELAALESLAQGVGLSSAQLLTLAVNGIMQAVQPDQAFLLRWEDGKLVQQKTLTATDSAEIPEHRAGEGACRLAAQEGMPVFTPNLQAVIGQTWEECKKAGLCSLATIPLKSGQEVIGAVCLGSAARRDFEAHSAFIATMVQQLSVALTNVRLQETAQRELAERQRAEEVQARLTTILESTTDLVSTATPDGKLTYMNRAGRAMAGWSADEPLEGRLISEFHPAWTQRKIQNEGLPTAAAAGHWRGETALLHRDGREIPVSQVIMGHRAPDGALQFFSTIIRDISELKQAEAALRASEQRYVSLLAATNEGVFDWDMAQPAVRVSRRWLEIYGLPPGTQPRPSAWRDSIHPDDLTRVDQGVQDYLDGKTAIAECEYRIRDGQGREKWVRGRMLVSRDTSGQPVRMYGRVTDITARKQAEEALAESEQRFRTLAEASFEGIAITENGVLLDCSEQLAGLVGLTRSDLIGRPVTERVVPEHRDTVIQAQREGRIGPYEVSLRRIDGTVIPVEVRARMAARGGRQMRITAVRDVSERQRAEEQLRQAIRRNDEALRVARMGHWEFDPETGQFLFNDQYYGLHGLTAAQAGGYTMSASQFAAKWVHPDDAHLVASHIRQAVETNDPNFQVQVEARVIHTDGKPRDLTVWFRIEKDAQGRTIKLHGVNQDITARKQAEKEKDALQAQLLQSQKMESVGRLAGGVAHDFNNMLTAILGHTELALGQCVPGEPIHTHLLTVDQCALRSADLVRQLLAFARRQTVAPQVLDLNQAVEGTVKMLRRLIGENINLIWTPQADLWRVRIDPSQVDQLLANLCVNARDAIAGVGKVTIETGNATFNAAYCAAHPDHLEGEYVMLAVSDNGCGMSKETLEHLFEPFFTTKEVGKGTGLGLATVYGIVKQNAGFVHVYSEPGSGTTFKIYLPRYQADGAAAEPEPAGEVTPGCGETILLVEDEARILDLGREMLIELGYQVLAASTPREAIRLAEEQDRRIDLLITDVVMPEMNGPELAKILVANRPGLRCLYTSGYTADVIAHGGVLDEGIRFLQKPFSMQQLAAKVRGLLEQQ